ncbi:unnamed protein product [Paramecium sonneborni]|uniref:Uncharacterized protein n=1 Tax=Paramecium sonneborni TaxID=65129 RepID=A0A8S1LN43_9CILI|nr:unnamed protein product [Paramecium sonneborni]
MSNLQNESLLISSLQNNESQEQNLFISQVFKMQKLEKIDQKLENDNFNQDEIDPRIKSIFLNLRNKIHFKNKEDELEFLDIIIYWNQCLQYNMKLNQLIMEYENQLIQNQQQIEFPVSKIHMIEYEESQQISLLISQNQKIDNQILKGIKIEKFTQTEYPQNKNEKGQQTDLEEEIDQDDNQNMIEFFSSSFYQDLKNKQFLIDAQLISLIQTMFLMHNVRKIKINQLIQQQIDNLMKRIKMRDQISYNTIIIMKESVKL